MAAGREDAPDVEGSEDESQDESETEETDDMVAYLEDPADEEAKRQLTRHMFPSKVGGRPAWLVPRHLPAMEAGADAASSSQPSLACKKCDRPLRFLLQIYASRGSATPDAFHRSLMLFVCTGCQPNEAVLLRAQLPWQNPFYGEDRPDGEAIAERLRSTGDADPELDPLRCHTCGLPCPAAPPSEAGAGASGECKECARLRRNKDPAAVFQERELTTVEADLPEEPDEEDEKLTAPRDEDVEEVYTDGAAKAVGKERDLVAEADGVIEAAKAKGASEAVMAKLEDYRSKVLECADNAMDASEQGVFDEYSKREGEHDPVFSKFNRYAAANNGHVIRYNFGDEPLWFCGPGKLEGGAPACGLCGGPRVFEFQVQPQLIAHLHKTSPVADRLDFGTLCCYTCEGSCGLSADAPYAEEFVFVQGEPREAWLPKA